MHLNARAKEVLEERNERRGLEAKAEIENFRVHDLRHTFASMAVMRGRAS